MCIASVAFGAVAVDAYEFPVKYCLQPFLVVFGMFCVLTHRDIHYAIREDFAHVAIR